MLRLFSLNKNYSILPIIPIIDVNKITRCFTPKKKTFHSLIPPPPPLIPPPPPLIPPTIFIFVSGLAIFLYFVVAVNKNRK